MTEEETIEKLKELAKENTTQHLSSNVETAKPLPFRVEKGYERYIVSGLSERRHLLKRSIASVLHDEKTLLRETHVKMMAKLEENRQIFKNWTFTPMYNEYKAANIYQALGERSMIVQGRAVVLSDKEEKNVRVPKNILNYVPTYVPPEKRIRIMENITFNKHDVIPVYSEIPNETIKSAVIPDSLLFEYIDVNFFNQLTEHNLARAVSMSQKSSNLIKCNCCSSEPIVPCYENPNCPCYKMNAKMQKFQKPADGCQPVKFTSLDPILFTVTKDHFYHHMGFACSELCGCKGNCTNNALLIPNKRIFPIEAYRTDLNVGFGIRSYSLIPAGTPVMEFVGEIIGEQVDIPNANWNNRDFAYKITYDDDDMIKIIIDEMDLSDGYKKLLQNLYDTEYYIDPAVSGNIARMANHSCAANLEMVRVFQKSLSPAHTHLVMVSSTDIFPGTPLTFDYGSDYVRRLKSKCQCGTFICMNGPEAKNLKKATHATLTKCHKELCDHQLAIWYEEVSKHNQ